MKPKKVRVMAACELWSINRWLRFTGFRVAVRLPAADEPTELQLVWWGFGS